MKRSIHGLLCFLSIALLITACNKKELDQFYGKPSNLAPPIYDQLNTRGFTSMAAVIDKAGYRDILGKAGYWTLFAPTNEAFQKFLQSKGLASINDIDIATAEQIVRMSTLYNTYRKGNISDYEAGTGAISPGLAFRKKSTYYDFVYSDGNRKVVGANSNSRFVIGPSTTDLNYSYNNNKFLPIFTDAFIEKTPVVLSDYTTLYPGAKFSGFNVMDASVVESDIVAENGIIHSLDKVLTPVQNFDQYLASNPNYSEYRRLLQLSALYTSDFRLQQRYLALSGSNDSVFIKTFNKDQQNYSLSVWPTNENFLLSFSGVDAQTDMFSMAVPTNDVLLAYEQYLLKDWGSNVLSPDMVRNLVNSHMWQTALWPSQMAVMGNAYNELPTFNQANVTETKFLSNGIFYGLNKVQEANVFRTLYSKPFLNFRYALMTRAINESGMRTNLLSPKLKGALVVYSDDQLRTEGFGYSELYSEYEYTNPATGAYVRSSVSRDRLFRILRMSSFENTRNQADNLAGEGFLKGSGDLPEYVYYKNNQLYASGNLVDGSSVTVTKTEQTANGPVYYTTGVLRYTEKPLGTSIKDLSVKYPTIYGSFYNFLKSSTIWTVATEAITGISLGVPYTVAVPTNAAISQAVKDGLLPATGAASLGVPNFNPPAQVDKDRVAAFLQYHFVKAMIVSDGDPDTDKQGQKETAYKNENLPPPFLTYVGVTNLVNDIRFQDRNSGVAKLVLQYSNNLADRAIIHAVDRVLDWR